MLYKQSHFKHVFFKAEKGSKHKVKSLLIETYQINTQLQINLSNIIFTKLINISNEHISTNKHRLHNIYKGKTCLVPIQCTNIFQEGEE